MNARDIITSALTYRLNRLSPGEAPDADLLASCLVALNDIADEWNGQKSFLFREGLTASIAPISTSFATLGIAWPDISPGDEILGATVKYTSTLDVPLESMTMQQYANVSIKSISSIPEYYAYDGYSVLFFYPVPTGYTITLRTKQVITEFADLDTEYGAPKGYRSALSDVLAERMAPTLLGTVPLPVEMAGKAAKRRIGVQVVNPAIINGDPGPGPVVRIMRGY